jgi:NADPH:quinone reductase-like Zn-dependent oxidoreductase
VKAAVLTEPGTPPTYGDHSDPDGPVLVRVTAAPIVPLDLLTASGTSYFGRPATPYVPGVQGVGVVERSATLAAGTRVWFATDAGMKPGDGSLAEFCAVPEKDVIPLEADIADEALAALGLSAVAAWVMLTARGRMQPGEHVLVLGAGGAVGQAAVGAAKLLGAGRVVAVCRSEEAQERARKAGADVVVPLTGDVDALTARFQDALDGKADVVIDPVFGIAATAAARVLGERGRLINVGGASGDVAEFSSAVLRSRTIDVLGYTNNTLTPEVRADALTAVAGHAAAGRLAVAHEVLPLAQVTDAWRRQASGQAGVRLVLTP